MPYVLNQDIESKRLVMKSNHLFVLSTVAIAAGLTACGGSTSITPATTEQVQSPSASVAPTLSAALSAPETRLIITSVPEVASGTSARAAATILFQVPSTTVTAPAPVVALTPVAPTAPAVAQVMPVAPARPPAPTPVPGPAPAPAPAPAFANQPANLVGSVRSSTYAASSEELQAFNRLNAERSQCGFGLLAQSIQLDAAAKAHND